jgi:hypothetical protein
MKVTVIDNKTGKEKVMDRRFAKVLTRMGRATYLTRDMIAQEPSPLPPQAPAAPEDDELAGLRAEYYRVFAKRPFHGWDADTLLAKIAEPKE